MPTDSSYYYRSLDETVRILRTIELIKIATIYKSRTNYNDTEDVYYFPFSQVPNYIRQLDYHRMAYRTTDNSDIVAKRESVYKGGNPGGFPYDTPITMTITVYPVFPVSPNTSITSLISSGIITDLTGSINVHCHDASGKLVNFTITDSSKQYVNGVVNLPGLFRAFNSDFSLTPAEIHLTSPGTSLTSITIPKSVTNLGTYTFYNCRQLSQVGLNADVHSIPEACFGYCTSLSSLTIPKSVTSLGVDCFTHCSSLSSIALPQSLQTISARAFEYCSGLSSITIGKNVNYLGLSAFAMCTNLGEIYMYPTTPPTLELDSTGNATSFYGIKTGGTLHVPSGTFEAYQAWCSSAIGNYSHLDDYGWTVVDDL